MGVTRGVNKKRFSVTLTGIYVDRLESLVTEGVYLDHQDAIRAGLRHLFLFHGMEPLYKNRVEEAEKVQE